MSGSVTTSLSLPLGRPKQRTRQQDTFRLDREGLLSRPPERIEAGERLVRVPIGGDSLALLVGPAARRALGTASAALRNMEVVWSEGGDELAVDPAGVTMATIAGAVTLTVPVSCDQTGPETVEVTFAVGSAGRPAGLYAETEGRPRGSAVIVDRWGDALIALAWSTLLELAESVAGTFGRDDRGDRLIPGSLVAADDGLEIVPLARHLLGRLQP